jgi:hypothetical protein
VPAHNATHVDAFLQHVSIRDAQNIDGALVKSVFLRCALAVSRCLLQLE